MGSIVLPVSALEDSGQSGERCKYGVVFPELILHFHLLLRMGEAVIEKGERFFGIC